MIMKNMFYKLIAKPLHPLIEHQAFLTVPPDFYYYRKTPNTCIQIIFFSISYFFHKVIKTIKQ